MIANPVVYGAGTSVNWTVIQSEESKVSVTRAPPAGAISTFVIPGNGNPESALLIRERKYGSYACMFRNQEDSNLAISSYPPAVTFELTGYSDNVYTVQCNAFSTVPLNELEYTLIEFF